MSNFNSKLNKEFGNYVLSAYVLDEAVDWIKSNLDPEDVFDGNELEEWALNNGFVRKDD